MFVTEVRRIRRREKLMLALKGYANTGIKPVSPSFQLSLFQVAEDHGLSITSSGAVFASAFVLQIVSTPIFGKYLQRIGSAR